MSNGDTYPTGPVLAVSGVDKAYGKHIVLRGVGLDVEQGRTLTILGKSGCGKTTLLKIIAGLTEADRGEVRIRGRNVAAVPLAARNVVYMYQEPLLFPHLNVFENIAFGLRVRNLPEREIGRRVDEMIGRLELAGYERRMPHHLSGGQRQRAAFGRGAIVGPEVLLLDEPFSNLDPETRGAMQRLFRSIVETYRIASVFVTHDLKEAIILGDEIACMNRGTLVRFSSREEFIDHPEFGARKEIDFWTSLERGAQEQTI